MKKFYAAVAEFSKTERSPVLALGGNPDRTFAEAQEWWSETSHIKIHEISKEEYDRLLPLLSLVRAETTELIKRKESGSET